MIDEKGQCYVCGAELQRPEETDYVPCPECHYNVFVRSKTDDEAYAKKKEKISEDYSKKVFAVQS